VLNFLISFITADSVLIIAMNLSVKIFLRNDSVTESEELERELNLEVKELVANELVTHWEWVNNRLRLALESRWEHRSHLSSRCDSDNDDILGTSDISSSNFSFSSIITVKWVICFLSLSWKTQTWRWILCSIVTSSSSLHFITFAFVNKLVFIYK